MFKNSNVTNVHLAGTPSQGARSAQKVDMPAKNHQTIGVKLGSAQKSKFGEGVQGAAAQKIAIQPSDSKANMIAKNDQNSSYSLGNTKHAVGSVPNYLKSKY